MKSESPPNELVLSIIAGVIVGGVLVVCSTAFSALIFSGPLAGYVPQGVGILLLGTISFALFSAFKSSYPINLMVPQEMPIIILVFIATNTSVWIDNGRPLEEAFGFVFMSIALTSILMGIFFWLMGVFRLGELVRYIPYPVIGGFLAGTGWLLVEFSFLMMTDRAMSLAEIDAIFSWGSLLQWVPGVVLGVLLLLGSRLSNHYLVTPAILLCAILLFFGISFSMGLSFNDLEQKKMLLGPFPDGSFFVGSPFQYLSDFDFWAFANHLPAILSMMLINVVSLLFNYSGLELIVRREFDLNKELRLHGYSNLITGFVGGPPGFLALAETSMIYRIGGRSRLTSITVVIVCLMVLFLGGGVISLFPKFMLGGLIFYLGISFLVEWLYDTRHNTQLHDYLLIILILVSVVAIGFLSGVAIGILVSVILFVISYSKVHVIRHQLNGCNFHSNVERPPHEKRLLRIYGKQNLILSLQGFIFFGTANHLLNSLQMRLNDKALKSLRHVVFDFQQVTGLDSSATQSFHKLQMLAQRNEFVVVFCNVRSHLLPQLNLVLNELEHNIFHQFDDLDYALEWCENRLVETNLNTLPPLDDMEQLGFLQQMATVFSHLEEKEYKSGDVLIKEFEPSKGLFFVKTGRVTIQISTKDKRTIRLKAMNAGVVVGEVSFYRSKPASASVVAQTDCTVLFLSRSSFRQIHVTAPEEAIRLHTYIVELLSDRLSDSNAKIQALMN